MAGKGKRGELTARAAALRFLSYRARTVKEVTKKLRSGPFEDSEIETTIEDLIEDGYLDDLKFARDIASSRKRNKAWGRRKIAYDLRKFGVPGDLIDSVLSETPETEELETAWRALEAWTRKRGLAFPLENKDAARAVRHLESLGFATSQSIRTLKDHNSDNDIK